MEPKKFAQLCALAAFFGGAAWLGLYLWWHFKCLGAVNTLEQQCSVPQPGLARRQYVPEDAEQALQEAGCRGLLYLVNGLKNVKNPCAAVVITELIGKITNPQNDGVTNPGDPPLRPPLPGNGYIKYDDQPTERDAKIRNVVSWWEDNAKQWHQGWRVWSDHCPAPSKP
jgi:hypothetical protein